MNILCLASYEKGHEFLRQAKRQGCGVMLVTSLSLQGKAEWPAEAIDEIFYMPDQDHGWNRADTIKAVSYLARTRAIDRVVALDDFDVDMAASLREHLRLPGMGETTVRHFRDKLAMRLQARESGLNVPDFVHALNYDALRRFMDHTPAPWVLKPRSMAGAIGITKIHRAEDLWPAIELLGDLQSFYLLEQFVPGDIFHVDSIVSEKQVVFAIASGYGRPPMEVSHGGGIFTTSILERESDDALGLVAENQRVMEALGMVRGASHTEFIKARADGRIYFLETSARVGGRRIPAAGSESGLRGPVDLSLSPAASRYVGVQRRGNRLAPGAGSPRGSAYEIPVVRAHPRTAIGVRAALHRGFLRLPAAARQTQSLRRKWDRRSVCVVRQQARD